MRSKRWTRRSCTARASCTACRTSRTRPGRRLPLARRQALVTMAAAAGVPIVEDDPYGELGYSGEPLPSLLSMNPAGVVYLGSFSKVLSPGLRLGYVVAPVALHAKLVQAKQAADLHTPSFNQRIVHEVLRDDFLAEHVPLIRERYARQCALMLDAMARHFPSQVRWNQPEGGMFLWVTLPSGIDSQALLQAAIARNVAFVPGAPFFAAEPAAQHAAAVVRDSLGRADRTRHWRARAIAARIAANPRRTGRIIGARTSWRGSACRYGSNRCGWARPWTTPRPGSRSAIDKRLYHGPVEVGELRPGRRRAGRPPRAWRAGQGGAPLSARPLPGLDAGPGLASVAGSRRRVRREPVQHRHDRSRCLPGRSFQPGHGGCGGLAAAATVLEALRSIWRGRHGPGACRKAAAPAGITACWCLGG